MQNLFITRIMGFQVNAYSFRNPATNQYLYGAYFNWRDEITYVPAKSSIDEVLESAERIIESLGRWSVDLRPRP